MKAEIQRAAALLGVDETAFVTSAAYDRARATIQDHQLTVLSPEDQDAFLAVLEAPPSPAQALKQAVRQHRDMVRKGAWGRCRHSHCILDILDEGGTAQMGRRRRFYQRMGFKALPSRPDRMFFAI